ncbi:MAG: NADH-quinone oxidoreductase subunit NuoN [Alphaproteobacteria bacterium]|nr:NADH-quinone oxidoreductase subunit NuoN [Alphaproteobacteria bacterium]
MIDFTLVAPEVFLACSGLFLLLFSVFRGRRSFISTTALAVVVLLGTAFLVVLSPAENSTTYGMFATGAFQRLAKMIVLGASGFGLIVASGAFPRAEDQKPEIPVLVLLATLGMMLMISASDLIGLYVGIELQNLPLYVLVSMRLEETRSSEAGLKYFMLGAVSSAIMLFGLSFVYGFAGTTSFAGIAQVIGDHGASLPLGLGLGLIFVVAGLAFKISAVPFHMWTPDVYEGAPTPVTALLASASKVAAMALVTLVLARPFVAMASLWQPALIVLSIASMALGAFAGLRQTNLKRLMGYSAIVNVGTILIGVIVVGGDALSQAAVAGVQGVLVYLAVYATATLAILGSLSLLGHKEQGIETIPDLAGLSQTQPAVAAAMSVALFSLAGIPPLAGFFGKYSVLLAAVQGGFIWLAIIGVLTSVIAAAYYLRIVKIMYFDSPKGLPVDVTSGTLPKVFVMLLSLSLVVFILYPAPFLEQAQIAAESLLFK